ncbi:MAG TPA: Fe-S oxidoreductase, partial [Gammaproteobacteria bacterium]|nr:Fe-S oxidoreductase [Gammaproteobacteria bacterium]
YFDALPILLMTNAALRTLQRISQEAGVNSLFDIRRFRPNLLIDVDGEGFPENDWVGRRAAIGEAVLK